MRLKCLQSLSWHRRLSIVELDLYDVCKLREEERLSCNNCEKSFECDNFRLRRNVERPSHFNFTEVNNMGLKNFNGNKFEKIEWNVKTEGFKFKKCSEMELNKEYTVHGLFITKDRGYGYGPAAILDDCFLNLPTSMLDTVKNILKDEEAIAELKSGNAKIKITSFTSKKYNKIGYSVEFC